MGVSCCCEDFKYTIVDGEEGYIECTSSEIVDDDLGLAPFFVKSVRNGGGGGFVDDTQNLKTGDGTGVFGCLALSIVEVWR